jgi:LDH2 family malate/lactate/ureidoglycolate dehydrogenase
MTLVPGDTIRDQIGSVFGAWGMSAAHATTAADMMVEADLRGVDSHGVSMLPTYDSDFRSGRLNVKPSFRTVRDAPAMALIDADASLGHPVSVYGMNMAVDKCLATGVAIVSVVNSGHFGAAACYSRIAADRGVIGMVTTTAPGVMMVPTFGAEPMLGTNPIAFAAPAERNPPFDLDMATTTVAAGKVKVHMLNHKPIPAGWVVDGEGRPVTDELEGYRYLYERTEGGMTPVGGSRELGGHKGYGLAVMVQILAGTLAGAAYSPIHQRAHGPSEPYNLGHFFLAINPAAFRSEGDFERDLDGMIDVLHASRPTDPSQPVLVAGDPEAESRRRRSKEGVPIPDDLMDLLKGVADRAAVPFTLAG